MIRKLNQLVGLILATKLMTWAVPDTKKFIKGILITGIIILITIYLHSEYLSWSEISGNSKFISKYATENIDEDLAESVVAWVGLRCKPERIKKTHFKKVSEGIKNRLKFIDNYANNKAVDTYPMKCDY